MSTYTQRQERARERARLARRPMTADERDDMQVDRIEAAHELLDEWAQDERLPLDPLRVAQLRAALPPRLSGLV